jgi:hypothetical protein
MADRTPETAFTDAECTFLRHVRFGELPARVPLAQLVAMTETDPPRDLPEPLGDPYEWRLNPGSGG